MISRLTGRIEPLEPGRALIDVAGVAYEIAMPQRDIDALHDTQRESAQVITDLIQRDDGPVLFGFLDWRGRVAFRTLRRLPGLGPAKALEILDHLGIDALHAAIGSHDQKALTRVPGIGPKVAKRILTEWPDAMRPAAGDTPAPAPRAHSPRSEALEGLQGLGYAETEASEALDRVLQDNPNADAKTLLSATLRMVAQNRMKTGRPAA